MSDFILGYIKSKDSYKTVAEAQHDIKWLVDTVYQLRKEAVKAKKEVALDCALMAENDYSTADVAIEIRKKYGLESVHSDRFCLKEVDQ